MTRLLPVSLTVAGLLVTGCYTKLAVNFGNGTGEKIRVKSAYTGQEVQIAPSESKKIFEDCAVCRLTLKDGTVVDRVLGCVRFDFVRHIDGTAEIVPGKTVIKTKSQPPTRLCKKALQNWTDWTTN